VGWLTGENRLIFHQKSYRTHEKGYSATSSDGSEKLVFLYQILLLPNFLRQIEIIPADNRVFDQAFASFRDLLLLSGGIEHFSSIGEEDDPGGTIRLLYFSGKGNALLRHPPIRTLVLVSQQAAATHSLK
jgi:hypothetical protein